LPKYCAGFEIDTAAAEALMAERAGYLPLPRFPGVKQDITLKTKADLSYSELQESVSQAINGVAPKNTIIKLEPLGIFQRQDDHSYKQTTFRLTITSYERTLTDIEVNQLLDNLAEAANTKFGAERI
jgi:phenylalanyl-tRNA synthetase beta subunit